MKKDEPLKGNASEALNAESQELLKSVKATETFKSTYAKDESLLKAMLENRFNKQSLDELSDYQLEELGKYLKKLDSYGIGKKELATKNQISYIAALWAGTCKTREDNNEKSILAHIKKMLKRDVKSLEALSKKEADVIIGGLKTLNQGGHDGTK